MIENSRIRGEIVLEELKRMKPDWIKEIRGKGLWFAIELEEGQKFGPRDVAMELMENRVLTFPSHGVALRMVPPLVVGDEECEFMLQGLNNVFKKFSN